LRHRNFRTFQDCKVSFPELSSNYMTFQGLEKSEKFQDFEALSRKRGGHLYRSYKFE
jgi:hypothetical protein